MAEFKCYICSEKAMTGEKFTFTNSGAVHFDCFISHKRKELGAEHSSELSDLAVILDAELTHLLALLKTETHSEEGKKHLQSKYKEIEKTAGETTKLISSLHK
ncbi:MAG: DUF2175 family protein [Thermoplasmataceae archaeon]